MIKNQSHVQTKSFCSQIGPSHAPEGRWLAVCQRAAIRKTFLPLPTEKKIWQRDGLGLLLSPHRKEEITHFWSSGMVREKISSRRVRMGGYLHHGASFLGPRKPQKKFESPRGTFVWSSAMVREIISSRRVRIGGCRKKQGILPRGQEATEKV